MQTTFSRSMRWGEKGRRARTRLAVVDFRQRIEAIATSAVRQSSTSTEVTFGTNRIRERLVFLIVVLHGKVDDRQLLGQIRLVQHIYKRTSDVLHGRSNMLNISDVLLTEWDVAISELEKLSEVG